MSSRNTRYRAGARPMVAVLLAAAGHLVLFGAVALYARFSPPPAWKPGAIAAAGGPGMARPADDARPLEVETIVSDLERPDTRSPAEKRREEEKKKEEEDKDPKGQVVDIARPAIEQRPDKANFLAEYDSKVDRETKGKPGRAEAGSPEPVAPVEAERRPEAALPTQPEARPGRPGPVAMLDPGGQRRTAPPARAPSATPDEDGQTPASPRQVAPGTGGEAIAPGAAGNAPPEPAGEGGVPGLPGRPSLLATPEMLQRAIGRGTGSMDYLRDVESGDSTALNARRWKHATFFNRVKRAVAQEWHPDVVYVRRDPSGNVYGIKDRVTVLRIHLEPDGKLASWNVLQSCGIDFLDEEAVDAFRKAAPFPNPPRELVEGDGQIHFNFAFIFELSGRAGFKVYKYE